MTIQYEFVTHHGHAGRATIAYDAWVDEEIVHKTVGVTFCGPRDNFCRKLGKAKARGYMMQAIAKGNTPHGFHSTHKADGRSIDEYTKEARKEALELVETFVPACVTSRD